MKKFIVGSLVTVTLLGTLGTVSVSADTTNQSSKTMQLNETMLTNQTGNNQEQVVSPVMSFEEMVNQVARDFNISTSEAQAQLGFSEAEAARAVRAEFTYRTLSSMFTVNSSYKPTMRFYCQTTEGGGFRAIKKILQVNMIRGYQGLSKQFQGKVYVNLEDPNRVFYIVNGDFYNNGTTTVNAGVNIGLGQSANVSFGVSNTSSHYQYRYVEAYCRF